eukprot:g5768.t1
MTRYVRLDLKVGLLIFYLRDRRTVDREFKLSDIKAVYLDRTHAEGDGGNLRTSSSPAGASSTLPSGGFAGADAAGRRRRGHGLEFMVTFGQEDVLMRAQGRHDRDQFYCLLQSVAPPLCCMCGKQMDQSIMQMRNPMHKQAVTQSADFCSVACRRFFHAVEKRGLLLEASGPGIAMRRIVQESDARDETKQHSKDRWETRQKGLEKRRRGPAADGAQETKEHGGSRAAGGRGGSGSVSSSTTPLKHHNLFRTTLGRFTGKGNKQSKNTAAAGGGRGGASGASSSRTKRRRPTITKFGVAQASAVAAAVDQKKKLKEIKMLVEAGVVKQEVYEAMLGTREATVDVMEVERVARESSNDAGGGDDDDDDDGGGGGGGDDEDSDSDWEYESWKYHQDGQLDARSRAQMYLGLGVSPSEIEKIQQEFKMLRALRLRTARSLTGKKVIAGEDPDEVEKWEVEMLKKEQAAAAAREASFEEAHRRTKEKTEAAQAEAGF